MIGPKTIDSMKTLAVEKIDTYAEKMNDSLKAESSANPFNQDWHYEKTNT